MRTIATDFGDFHCNGEEWVLDFLASLVYFGSFFGYISISLLADNFGRKTALLISFGIATLGMILVGLAPNLVLVGVGLFLAGFGSDTAINICFYFVTETVGMEARQKHSVIIQFFFSLGGVVNVGYFYFFKNWRLIMWVFAIVPSLGCLVMVFLIVQETPFFLIKLKSV